MCILACLLLLNLANSVRISANAFHVISYQSAQKFQTFALAPKYLKFVNVLSIGLRSDLLSDNFILKICLYTLYNILHCFEI